MSVDDRQQFSLQRLKHHAMSSPHKGKIAAGNKAVSLIEDGMTVGLGTGSTAAVAIEALGKRIKQEGLSIIGTPTSYAAELLAKAQDIPLCDLDAVEEIDIAFDGADEVDGSLNLIKGRGAAHTREKVVASLARRFLVLVDESKMVNRLGVIMPVPVEVIPMAAFPIMRRLEALGARPEIRISQGKDGPVVSDQGFWIIDAHFDGIPDPYRLDTELKNTAGVLDHGLFLGLATDVLVGADDGSVRHLQASRKNEKTPSL
jgi:ribose 5-phosphate isomerase A